MSNEGLIAGRRRSTFELSQFGAWGFQLILIGRYDFFEDESKLL